MRCTPEELALKARFEAFYARSLTPVMLAVERAVCGCNYGGNSWTDRATADDIARRLARGDKDEETKEQQEARHRSSMRRQGRRRKGMIRARGTRARSGESPRG